MRYTQECTGVDDDMISLKRKRKTVHTARGRTIEIFAIAMIMSSMRGAFEASALIVEFHGCTQVDAALVKG
jgi:hypothetical protein